MVLATLAAIVAAIGGALVWQQGYAAGYKAAQTKRNKYVTAAIQAAAQRQYSNNAGKAYWR